MFFCSCVCFRGGESNCSIKWQILWRSRFDSGKIRPRDVPCEWFVRLRGRSQKCLRELVTIRVKPGQLELDGILWCTRAVVVIWTILTSQFLFGLWRIFQWKLMQLPLVKKRWSCIDTVDIQLRVDPSPLPVIASKRCTWGLWWMRVNAGNCVRDC